jgi:hypothetical protein
MVTEGNRRADAQDTAVQAEYKVGCGKSAEGHRFAVEFLVGKREVPGTGSIQ